MTSTILNFQLNKLLNLEYGSFKANYKQTRFISKLKKTYREKIKKLHSTKVYTERLASIRHDYARKGIAYCGNFSCHPKFNQLNEFVINNLEPTKSRWGPITTEKLGLRDNLLNRPQRLLAFTKHVCSIDRQPSITANPSSLLPAELLDRISIAVGYPCRWGALNAWSQVTVPHRPRIHRDGFSLGGVKIFLLLEDVDLNRGPTKVYSRLQSRLISLFRRRKHLGIIESHKGCPGLFLFGQKPTYLTGKRGDVYIFDPNICLHAEGELEIGQKRLIAEATTWPEILPVNVGPYKPKPISE